MNGEPAPGAPNDARLVATSCEKSAVDQVEATVKAMRIAVDASFRDWHDGQPECWAEDRAEYEAHREDLQMDTFSRGGGGHMMPKPAMTTPPRRAAMSDPTSNGKSAGDSPGKSKAPRAGSASGTNNQVASVDEADIVKNDGRYVYLAANGALRIVEALKPKMISVTKLPGTAREMFVEGDRAVVYTANGTPGNRCTYGYDCAFSGDGTSTTVSVFDIHDRAEPKLVRQIELSGSLVSARRIGGAIHTVVAEGDQKLAYQTWPNDFEMCGTMEPAVRAKFAKLKADQERTIRAKKSAAFPSLRDNGTEQSLCDGVLRTAIQDGQAFTTVVSFDMREDKVPATSTTLQSRPGAVFASADALYVSVVHQRENAGKRWFGSYQQYLETPEVSEIHKFKIGATPRDTR